MKNRLLIALCIFCLLSITTIISYSFSLSDNITSKEYTINNNTIYAVPTSYELTVSEFLSCIDYYSKVDVYNSDDELLTDNDILGTGSKLKINNTYYSIIVLGDVTGDGLIQLGDVAKLYNAYKNKIVLDENYLKAGKVTNNSNITLGDVAKLYNFYKGKSPFSYYSESDINLINSYINKANSYADNISLAKIGTNVIHDLNLGNISENDSIIITKNKSIELSILKNNKCYRKDALSDDIRVIEDVFCNTNIGGYVSNNGDLHVSGSKILNEDNKEIIFRGFSSGTSTRLTQNWSTWYTNDSFKTIHDWGTNLFRITFKPEQYATNPEYINDLYNYIDLATDNDLYVLISWMGNSDFTNYINSAKEFFNLMSTRYKNSNNILYEICNEPFGSSWSTIKSYADEIIPIIRSNTNAIIVVPAAYHIVDSDDYVSTLLDNPINDTNTIYSTHMYVAHSLSSNTVQDILKIKNEGKVIFISEWGTTESDGSGGFYKDNSDLWVDFLERNKIGWLNFNISDVYWNNTPYLSSVVKPGEWKYNLHNSILSESGKYMKKVLTNTNELTTKSLLMSRKDDYGFFKEEYRTTIKHIVFKVNNYIPDEFGVSFDVSMTLNGSVKAYIVNDTLYISSINDILYAPSNMKYFFKDFTNLVDIDFTNLNTNDVINMSYLFQGDSSLNSINFSNINTSKVTNMSLMFSNCVSLTTIDMSNLNLSSLTNMSLMFIWNNNLTNLYLPIINESIITDSNDVFYKTGIDVTNWNIHLKSTNRDFIVNLINNSTNPNLSYTIITD